jgi:hypothetical protein
VRLSELLQDSAQTTVHTAQPGTLILAIFLGVAGYIACVHAFLPTVHEALEFLVR